jgi:hypothetical protein
VDEELCFSKYESFLGNPKRSFVMIKGTTPTHTFNVPLSAENIKKVKITYEQDGTKVLTKRENDCDIEDCKVTVRLTQEETLKFNHEKLVSIQIRLLSTADDALTSYPFLINATECLDNEVL